MVKVYGLGLDKDVFLFIGLDPEAGYDIEPYSLGNIGRLPTDQYISITIDSGAEFLSLSKSSSELKNFPINDYSFYDIENGNTVSNYEGKYYLAPYFDTEGSLGIHIKFNYNIQMHPINEDGEMDYNDNLYPKTKIENVDGGIPVFDGGKLLQSTSPNQDKNRLVDLCLKFINDEKLSPIIIANLATVSTVFEGVFVPSYMVFNSEWLHNGACNSIIGFSCVGKNAVLSFTVEMTREDDESDWRLDGISELIYEELKDYHQGNEITLYLNLKILVNETSELWASLSEHHLFVDCVVKMRTDLTSLENYNAITFGDFLNRVNLSGRNVTFQILSSKVYNEEGELLNLSATDVSYTGQQEPYVNVTLFDTCRRSEYASGFVLAVDSGDGQDPAWINFAVTNPIMIPNNNGGEDGGEW